MIEIIIYYSIIFDIGVIIITFTFSTAASTINTIIIYDFLNLIVEFFFSNNI